MQKNERAEFVLLIEALAAAFRAETTQAFLEGYWLGLEDLELKAVKHAVVSAMRQCKFLPSMAELRELAGMMVSADRALVAWAAFRKALNRHGYYDTVRFDDPILNATVRNLGGWIQVSVETEEMSTREFETFYRKKFEQIYAAFCRRGPRPDDMKPLMGFTEQENLRLGYDPFDSNSPFRNDQARRLTAECMSVNDINTGLSVLPMELLEKRPALKAEEKT